MKRKNLLLFPLLGLLALTSLFSCGVDRWAEYYPLTGRDLWIDSVMRQDYLWSEDMPAPKTLNYFQDPQAFLKAVLSPRDKGYSTVDTLESGPVLSYGFDYTLYKDATNDTLYNALITYVIPQSPAYDAGLSRGEWIMQIDGEYITQKRAEWLTKGDSRNLLIGKYLVQKDENGTEVGIIQSDRKTTISTARAVADVPISYASIIQLETSKVGYLTYSSFSSGPNNGSQAYNNQLRQISQEFKQAGVSDFVLDLRYNPGGEMECVQLLADILVPADKLNSPFAFLQYNQKQSAKNRDLILDNQLLQGGANLNLPKVYILTSKITAGAAEMLINCLKPYMTVILIGETTKGENVAVANYTNPQFPWLLRLVVCEVFNSNGEAAYADGFKPNYSISETSYLANFLPLGNPNEILLNTALNVIVGNIESPKAMTKGMNATKNVKVKRNAPNGLIIKENKQ